MTNADGYRFKYNWRKTPSNLPCPRARPPPESERWAHSRCRYMVGQSWSRPPTDSHWIKKTSWGFGMFEFLEFNERAGLQPYLCVNFDEDMPGLIEIF